MGMSLFRILAVLYHGTLIYTQEYFNRAFIYHRSGQCYTIRFISYKLFAFLNSSTVSLASSLSPDNCIDNSPLTLM